MKLIVELSYDGRILPLLVNANLGWKCALDYDGYSIDYSHKTITLQAQNVSLFLHHTGMTSFSILGMLTFALKTSDQTPLCLDESSKMCLLIRDIVYEHLGSRCLGQNLQMEQIILDKLLLRKIFDEVHVT